MSTPNSRLPYEVHVTMQPSCTCKDVQKFGTYTHCKHILFVLIFGHGITDPEILKKVSYTEKEIQEIVSKTVNTNFVKVKEKKPRSTKAQREDILRNDPHFNDPQDATLHIKTGQSAKCSGMNCKKVYEVGATCVKIDGSISIPYQQSFAKKQVKYFCPSLECLKKPPVWTNIRFPTEIKKAVLVSEALADYLNEELCRPSMV